ARGHAGHPAGAVRGRQDGRRQRVPGVPERDGADAAPHAAVRGRGGDDRRPAAVRRAAPVRHVAGVGERRRRPRVPDGRAVPVPDRVPALRLRLRGRHLLAAVPGPDRRRRVQRAARRPPLGEGRPVSAVPRRPGARRRRPPSLARTLTYVVLTITLFVSAFPIYWTFVVASSTNDVIADVPPPLVPGGHLIE